MQFLVVKRRNKTQQENIQGYVPECIFDFIDVISQNYQFTIFMVDHVCFQKVKKSK